jgi:hypothetical protein
MARVFIILTSGTTWVAPTDCTSITVECLSGGSTPNCHQTAYVEGSYSQSTNITVTPFQKYYYQVGAVSGSTWFNTINSFPVVGTQNSANSCLSFQSSSSSYSSGSQLQSDQITKSIGDYKYFGGISKFYYDNCPCPPLSSYYAGGGAAGPNGNGGSSNTIFNTGGGADGGTSAVGSVQGAGPLGNTDGTNGAPVNVLVPPLTNSQYILWTDINKNSYGIGSGFSTSGGFVSPTFNFIGYGSTNRYGLIVISYVPAGVPPNSYTEIYQDKNFTWKVPLGVSSIKVEALGAGGGAVAGSYLNGYGGGGGAYATNTISVSPGQYFTANVTTVADTDFSNTTTTFVKAGRGSTPTGGTVLAGTGYPGGTGAPNYGTNLSNSHGGGGGGAGGPNGPGGDGGLPYGPTGTTAGAGGGGGGAGLIGSPVTLTPSGLVAGGTLTFTIPSGKTLSVGTSVTVSGTFGSGGFTGYSNPTTYYVRTTNGSTTATFCTSYLSTIVTATATTNFGSVVFTISNRGGVGGLTSTGTSSSATGGTGGSGSFRDPGGLGGSTLRAAAAGVSGSGGGGGGLTTTTPYYNGAPPGDATIYTSAQSNTAIGFYISGGGGGGCGSSTTAGDGGTPNWGGGAGASGGGANNGNRGSPLLAITYTVANNNASESSMMSMF